MQMHRHGRRALLLNAGALGALATLHTLGAMAHAATDKRGGGSGTRRMPTIFIGHGSPRNAIADNAFTRRLSAWGQALPRPSAILSVSAHWLTTGSTAVGIQERPKTIHDFGGFAREMYEIEYPAPGHPAFARQAAQLVRQAPVTATQQWGLDHGTWTVLKFLYPKADVPVFQLSIDYDKPAAFHYAVGRDLAALRDQGVLILGSGNVVHNLRATDRGAADSLMGSRPWARDFDEAAKAALAGRDDKSLVDYARLAGASMAVATPDHYYPLLYPLGAAGPGERATTIYEGFQSGTLSMRCVQFG